MNYTRTDLCPTCNTRLDDDSKLAVFDTNSTTIYLLCKCCKDLWTKPEAIDFWILKHKEQFDA